MVDVVIGRMGMGIFAYHTQIRLQIIDSVSFLYA